MILAFFSGVPGPLELLVILLVILLLFGAKRLPDLARSLGRSLSEFKRGKDEGARILDASKADAKDGAEEDKKLDDKKDETS